MTTERKALDFAVQASRIVAPYRPDSPYGVRWTSLEVDIANALATHPESAPSVDGGLADRLRAHWTDQGIDPHTAKHMAIEAGAFAKAFYRHPQSEGES